MDWQSNPRLKSLAYGMLGSVADAEDVVQDAIIRLHQMDTPPESPEAYLYRVVSNLCIDRLRAEKIRRRDYQGPWLPDPYPLDAGEDLAILAEQLTTGFLLLLENLSPAERVVYVLREAFDYSFNEIAELLGISVANARQRASRARARVRAQAPPCRTSRSHQRRLLEVLVARITAGDVDGLMSLLAEDAVAVTDGGGVVSAAIRPVLGRDRIVQVTTHLARKAAAEGALEFSFVDVPSGVGLLIKQDGQLHSFFQIEADDARIQRIYVMRHPAKLAHLAKLGGSG